MSGTGVQLVESLQHEMRLITSRSSVQILALQPIERPEVVMTLGRLYLGNPLTAIYEEGGSV